MPCCVQVKTVKGDSFETDAYFPANPPDQDQNDHTGLLHLSDATLLENSRARYLKDEIYTYAATTLVTALST